MWRGFATGWTERAVPVVPAWLARTAAAGVAALVVLALSVAIGLPAIVGVVVAALAGGCSRVILSDLVDEKLAIAGRYPGVTTVKVKREKLADVVKGATDGWGADIVFEASGSARAYEGINALIRPGGRLIAIGMPVEPEE